MSRPPADARRSTLSELIVAHRAAVLILWAALASFCVPYALNVSDRLVVAGEVPGGEAAAAQSLISEDFARDDGRLLVLVVTGLTDTNQAQDLSARIATELETLDWIGSVDIRQVDAPYTDALIFVRLTDALGDSAALESLETVTGDLFAREISAFPTARLYWTGEIAVREEIIEASTKDLRRSEIRALPLSFFILWLAFGAVVAAVLPLGIGLVSMLLTLALAGILADFMAISIMVQSVASLLGLALGIDYALLVISQYRKELAEVVSGGQPVCQ